MSVSLQLAAIQHSDQELRISRETERGRTVVRLRVWFRSRDGMMRPGREGVELHPQVLAEVIAALRRADIKTTGGGAL